VEGKVLGKFGCRRGRRCESVDGERGVCFYIKLSLEPESCDLSQKSVSYEHKQEGRLSSCVI
jgi:hypothetical protein